MFKHLGGKMGYDVVFQKGWACIGEIFRRKIRKKTLSWVAGPPFPTHHLSPFMIMIFLFMADQYKHCV